MICPTDAISYEIVVNGTLSSALSQLNLHAVESSIWLLPVLQSPWDCAVPSAVHTILTQYCTIHSLGLITRAISTAWLWLSPELLYKRAVLYGMVQREVQYYKVLLLGARSTVLYWPRSTRMTGTGTSRFFARRRRVEGRQPKCKLASTNS